MKRLFLICTLFIITAVAAGCGGGVEYGWQHPDSGNHQLSIDTENCEWDATHEKEDDLSFREVERSDEEIEAHVKQCLEAKGYKWEPIND